MQSTGSENARSGLNRATYIRHLQQTTHTLIDPPLKEPGTLPVYRFDRVVCSPCLRCRATAKLLAGDKPVHIDTRLSEYQGHKRPQGRGKHLHPSTRPFAPLPDFSESWSDCAERLDRFDEWLQGQSGVTLVVTHGIVVNYMAQKHLGQCQWSRGRDVPFGRGFTAVLCQ